MLGWCLTESTLYLWYSGGLEQWSSVEYEPSTYVRSLLISNYTDADAVAAGPRLLCSSSSAADDDAYDTPCRIE